MSDGQKTYLLDEQDFYAWLAAQPPTESIGKPGSNRACPVARFLERIFPSQEFSVDPTRGPASYVGRYYTYIHGVLQRNILPSWANAFALWFDDAFAGEGTVVQQDLMARLATRAEDDTEREQEQEQEQERE